MSTANIQPSHTSTDYNYKVVRQFAIMAVVWGVVGMAVGLLIASQMVFPELNFGLPWTSFGRLRPLHTNAVIFAFGGCVLFATSYYVVQRTCQTRLALPWLASFTFWGWQLVIVLAAISLPMGFTAAKEYAELEWPIDILICHCLGLLRSGLFRHHQKTESTPYLCSQLVFWCIHYNGSGIAYCQQCSNPSLPDQILLCLCRCHGCHDPVVVWP